MKPVRDTFRSIVRAFFSVARLSMLSMKIGSDEEPFPEFAILCQHARLFTHRCSLKNTQISNSECLLNRSKRLLDTSDKTRAKSIVGVKVRRNIVSNE